MNPRRTTPAWQPQHRRRSIPAVVTDELEVDDPISASAGEADLQVMPLDLDAEGLSQSTGTAELTTTGAPGPGPGPVTPTPGQRGEEWVWELVGFDGERYARLYVRDRRVTRSVDGSRTASFTLDVLEAARLPLLIPGQVDVMVSRGDRPLIRGPLAGANGSGITIRGGTLTYNVLGIGELLADRHVPAGTIIEALEATSMAWQLIEDSQALPFGDLGITAGALPATAARSKTWDAPTPVLTAIRELAGLDPGFEWSIDPDPSGAYIFNAYAPRMGSTGTAGRVLLEAGRNVHNASTVAVDAGPGAAPNVVTVVGANGVQVTAESPAHGITYRRRERVITMSDVDDATILGDRATAELREADPRARAVLELFPGAADANLDTLDIGDVVDVDYRVGSLVIVGPYRILEWTAAIPNGAGVEHLSVTVEPWDE